MDFISLYYRAKNKFLCTIFLSHFPLRFHSAVKAIVGIMHIYNTAICIEVEFEKPNQASIYFKSAQLLQVPTHPKGRPDLHSAADAAFTQSIPKKVWIWKICLPHTSRQKMTTYLKLQVYKRPDDRRKLLAPECLPSWFFAYKTKS